MTTTKKNIKVKKDKGDISITIENNLNANNKQINNNHEPIERRRRRKKKVENNDEIDTLEELPPVTDTSYIKPGPVGAFKMVRPAQPGAGAGPGAQEISFDNFQRFLAMLMENQRNGNPANDVRPPPAWGRGLVDDDEPVIIPPPPADADTSSFSRYVRELGLLPHTQPADDDPVFPPPPQPEYDPPPPPTAASTDSDIFSLSSIATDDSEPILLPKRLFPRASDTGVVSDIPKKTIWVGADGNEYYEPPKRPPSPYKAWNKVLQNMDPLKAAYYANLANNFKDNLMRDLEAGPRRNTESLEAGPLMRD